VNLLLLGETGFLLLALLEKLMEEFFNLWVLLAGLHSDEDE